MEEAQAVRLLDNNGLEAYSCRLQLPYTLRKDICGPEDELATGVYRRQYNRNIFTAMPYYEVW